MTDVMALDAVGQADAVRRGELSAAELTDAYLARIERLDPVLNSYVTVDAAGARRAAADVDAGGDRAALAGVTFSVKDVVDVAGLATTHSCDLLADAVAEGDDPVVTRFRAGGLVLLGKTNVPEFCTSMTTSRMNGICRNPWDPSLSPTGSSGGAAVAVAAGLCSAAHGTDGAGSVRVPAALCGLVGLKPTRGLVAYGPLEGPAYLQTSVPGVLTRSVRDAAVLLDVMAPPGPWTPGRPRPFADEVGADTGRLRIGLCATPPYGRSEPACGEAVRALGRTLEELGHEVVEVTPPWELLRPGYPLPMSGVSPADVVDLADAGRVEPRNVGFVEQMATMTLLEHSRLVEANRAATKAFMAQWAQDVLVTPTTGLFAPPVDWAPWDLDKDVHRARMSDYPSFAQPFNVSGQPALSLPVASSPTGLPPGSSSSVATSRRRPSCGSPPRSSRPCRGTTDCVGWRRRCRRRAAGRAGSRVGLMGTRRRSREWP
jgi:amidase